MPNWCYNSVTFSGTSGDMENLVAQLASEASLFDFNKVIPMPLSWPVEVNYLEAKAFCNWKSIKENKKISKN